MKHGKMVYDSYQGRYSIGHTVLLQAAVEEAYNKNILNIEVKKDGN
jgi:hypothetical protein